MVVEVVVEFTLHLEQLVVMVHQVVEVVLPVNLLVLVILLQGLLSLKVMLVETEIQTPVVVEVVLAQLV
jgi:hypothetical protein